MVMKIDSILDGFIAAMGTGHTDYQAITGEAGIMVVTREDDQLVASTYRNKDGVALLVDSVSVTCAAGDTYKLYYDKYEHQYEVYVNRAGGVMLYKFSEVDGSIIEGYCLPDMSGITHIEDLRDDQHHRVIIDDRFLGVCNWRSDLLCKIALRPGCSVKSIIVMPNLTVVVVYTTYNILRAKVYRIILGASPAIYARASDIVIGAYPTVGQAALNTVILNAHMIDISITANPMCRVDVRGTISIHDGYIGYINKNDELNTTPSLSLTRKG